MTYTNKSIRELVNKANDSNWSNSKLNRQVIEADVSKVTDMDSLFQGMKDFSKSLQII
jgi:hypothetical protein